jgi:ELWxxDGT repeat protein
VTDGTAAGTQEITGIAGASASGLAPAWMTVYAGRLYFEGTDSSGAQGLWTSDGTASGTYELSVVGAYQGNLPTLIGHDGLEPTGLTAFDGKLYFSGLDSSGHADLWVSDGTGAGTTIIDGVTAPLFLGVVGGYQMFAGVKDSVNTLWRLDAGGNIQQATVTDAVATGVFSTSVINSGQFVALGDKMLFQGVNAAGFPALFVYDGATNSAHQLTDIVGAATAGYDGLDPRSFILYNGKALFQGYDASNQLCLWSSDGTAAGTVKITPISGDFYPTLVNGKVVFSDYQHLYVTDGTAAGTRQIVPPNDWNSYLDPTHITLTDLTLPCFARGTRLRTPEGDRRVETLQIGDRVVLACGGEAAIRWIGHRRLAPSRHPSPRDVWPIRIAARAFGDLPLRDLWVSPGHNLACDGALMPACALVNGVSIAQVEAETIEYWHVELAAHDILLAEGFPPNPISIAATAPPSPMAAPASRRFPISSRNIGRKPACRWSRPERASPP